jgi:hypothetical protein
MINSSFTLAHFVWLEGAGETSLDQVGGLTARLIGAPSWSRDAPFEDAGSIILDGASQFITVPGLLANGPREFTVALRYKPDVRLPASSDRRLWSITTSDSPEQTLDVLWRQQDDGGYLWIRGIGKTEREPNKGSEITTDVVAWGSHVPAVAWLVLWSLPGWLAFTSITTASRLPAALTFCGLLSPRGWPMPLRSAHCRARPPGTFRVPSARCLWKAACGPTRRSHSGID